MGHGTGATAFGPPSAPGNLQARPGSFVASPGPSASLPTVGRPSAPVTGGPPSPSLASPSLRERPTPAPSGGASTSSGIPLGLIRPAGTSSVEGRPAALASPALGGRPFGAAFTSVTPGPASIAPPAGPAGAAGGALPGPEIAGEPTPVTHQASPTPGGEARHDSGGGADAMDATRTSPPSPHGRGPHPRTGEAPRGAGRPDPAGPAPAREATPGEAPSPASPEVAAGAVPASEASPVIDPALAKLEVSARAGDEEILPTVDVREGTAEIPSDPLQRGARADEARGAEEVGGATEVDASRGPAAEESAPSRRTGTTRRAGERAPRETTEVADTQPLQRQRSADPVEAIAPFDMGQGSHRSCTRCGSGYQHRVPCCPSCQDEFREVVFRSTVTFQRAGYVFKTTSDEVEMTRSAVAALEGGGESVAFLRKAPTFVNLRDLLELNQRSRPGFATTRAAA